MEKGFEQTLYQGRYENSQQANENVSDVVSIRELQWDTVHTHENDQANKKDQ